MGCGQKSAYNDEQEEIYAEKISRIKKKKPEEVLRVLESVLKDVTYLSESDDISLPRYAWPMLEESKKEISKLIYGGK